VLGLKLTRQKSKEGAFMITSLQHFQSKGVKNIQKVFDTFGEDMSKMAEMIYGVTKEVTKLGLSMIAEEFESYDQLLRERKHIRQGWYIVRQDETTLTTSLGDVVYKKTLFRNKENGTYSYLLDELMGIASHTRITEDAVARILDEAVESSYRKGGQNACITGGNISKMTVLNKIHALEFPEIQSVGEKKKEESLYIDADEDHVSLQYLETKGDIKKTRSNTIMPRIVYVYEGVDTEEDGRVKLVNIRYFGGVYEGTDGIRKLWDEVYKYIENTYDTNILKQIYINGDGAAWIKSGVKYIAHSKFVLDKYHMHKYIMTATAHLEDSADDARSEIYRAIYKKKKWMAEGTFDKILSVTEKESKYKAVQAAKEYILANWSGIMLSMKSKDENIQCSAEGHVSHVYADRMSSRPLGWSRTGADKMSRLRIYWMNGGNMLDLVRYQKQELPMAAGAEEVICSASEMMGAERANQKRLGNLADLPAYSIPYPQIKKIAALKNHIWGL